MPDREEIIQKRLRRRKMAEIRFRIYGIVALLLAGGFLVFFFADMIVKGHSAFLQAYVKCDVYYNKDSAKITGYRKAIDKELQPVVSRAVLRLIPKEIRNTLLEKTTRAKRPPESRDTCAVTWLGTYIRTLTLG